MKLLTFIFCFFQTIILFCQSSKILIQESDSIRIEYELVPNTDSIYERTMFKYDILIEKMYVQRRIQVGSYMEYYDDGTLMGIGEYNSKGKPDGTWMDYYPNGQITNKRIYKNGGLNGRAMFYYPSGQLKAKGSYSSENHQYIISGYSLESLAESKIGEWSTFHPNGQPETKGAYWFSKPISNSPQERKGGITKKNIDDYMHKVEVGEYARIWKKDLKHGPWMEWDKDGILLKKEIYNRGELVEILNIKE
ncbi:hypothetical protein OAK19_01805 [Aureispira]|nr:hypothetical protein [Aureispira sp.]